MNQHSLNTLIELATEKRDADASALGALHGEQAQATEQLNALVSYRHEYRERLDRAMNEGVSMVRLENDQRFLATLDEAIAQQRRIIANNESRLAEGKSQWQSSQRRLKSFDTLASRRAGQAAKAESRREQRINDEAAARASQRFIV